MGPFNDERVRLCKRVYELFSDLDSSAVEFFPPDSRYEY